MSDSRIAVVLAGGAARGAYEVGVLDYLVNDVARALGRDVPLDILCGTSIGAVNACLLAAFADEPRGRVARMEKHWTALRIGHVLRPDTGEMFSMVRNLFTGSTTASHSRRPGGFMDTTGLERLVVTAIPFGRIDEQMRAGHLKALAVSTTQVQTGRTFLWVQRAEGGLPTWGRSTQVKAIAAKISAAHALASAAIPFVFPPVRIAGHFHSDGGLRQTVPLSPARKLGADGLIVVLPKYQPPVVEPSPDVEESVPTPLTLVGKTLNALLLDHLDNDLDRLRRINSILDAGTRRFGPDFLKIINDEMGNPPEKSLRPLRLVVIRASQNIGRLSVDFVRSPTFDARAGGMVARVLRRLAEGQGEEGRESDLLSYLLFDGEFATQLIELGRADAAAAHEDLCRFFDDLAPRP